MSNRGLSSYKYILVYKFANLWRAYKYVDKLGTMNYNTFSLAFLRIFHYSNVLCHLRINQTKESARRPTVFVCV